MKTNVFAVVTISCGLLLLFVLIAVAGAADLNRQCDSCHNEVIAKGKRNRYVHLPFMQGNCAACHVVDQPVAPDKKKARLVQEQEQLENIRWFRDARGIAAEHWVLLPQSKVKGELYVKAWDGSQRSPLYSIALPPLQSLPEKKSDLKAPVISNVQVPDVRRGISTSVTIQWQTDEFADSEVLYGKGAPLSSRYDDKLCKDHDLVLVGLDADAKYQFQVVSRDLFGNRSESKVLTFNTDRTIIAPDVQRTASRFSGRDVELDWQLARSGDNYLLMFSADRPVSLSLGVQRQNEADSAEAQVQPAAAAGSGHPLLRSQLETNITVCYSCHSSFRDSYSHPINVFPKSGMTIPADYPLLPDGRISCMSCHSSHGANYEYRLIRKGKKELCLGCHTEY